MVIFVALSAKDMSLSEVQSLKALALSIVVVDGILIVSKAVAPLKPLTVTYPSGIFTDFMDFFCAAVSVMSIALIELADIY